MEKQVTHNKIHKLIKQEYRRIGKSYAILLNINSIEAVFNWIDNNKNVSEICWNNGFAIVTTMFRPNYHNFVVSDVPHLKRKYS